MRVLNDLPKHGTLAQLVEQGTFNPKVVDSSSTGSTRNKHSALLARGVMAAQGTVNPSVESSNLSEPAEHYEKYK